MYVFIHFFHSFVHSFIRSFTRSSRRFFLCFLQFTPSFIHSSVHPSVYSFIFSLPSLPFFHFLLFAPWSVLSFTPSLIYPSFHRLIFSICCLFMTFRFVHLVRSLVYLFIRSYLFIMHPFLLSLAPSPYGRPAVRARPRRLLKPQSGNKSSAAVESWNVLT